MGSFFIPESVVAIDHLAPVLLDIAARSVVILALAGLTALAMRRASAAARHWVWLLGFAGLLLLPVLAALLPGWHVLPRMEMNRAAPVESMTIESSSSPTIAVPVQTAMREEQPTHIRSEAPATIEHPAALAPAAAPLQGGGRLPPADRAAPASSVPPVRLPWTFWLVLVWLGGAILVLGHVLLGFLSLWLLQRRCARIAGGDLPEVLDQLCKMIGVGRSVELLGSPLRTMPMTWGLWRARLLLPEEARHWPSEQRRDVLLHELGHVRRNDCLAQFLAQIGCALYWFNPLVWIAWRGVQIERERACDDLVLNSGAKASAYAEHLLHSAAAMPTLRFIGAAALAMARPSTLEGRLRTILDANRNRRSLTISGALLTILLLVCALIPVAVLKAQESPAAETVVGGSNSSPATRPTIGEAVPGRRGATFSGGRASRGFGGGGGQAVVGRSLPGVQTIFALGEGPTCTLDATIYDVRLPGSAIGRLDVDALTHAAATPEAFEKALAELGTTQPLYRADQSVRLAKDSINIGTNVPYVSNSQITAQGNTINSVAYSNVGALFDLAGRATGPNSMELDLHIQVSTLAEGTTPISATVKAPLFHSLSMSRMGPVQAHQPFVVLSIDAASTDADGKAVAYIARVILGAPQFPSAPARGE